ncbi:hypothetical protein GCM10023093_19930 [Nemorincola caseinilytica]|uniref:Lipoprotein n=1 Tax=Nemorincola caseinilytica TaxID=2054315 RepID=A0ABP8NIB1_9BACT
MRYFLFSILFAIVLPSCSRDDTGWKTHTIPEGNFSADMPSPVQKAEKTEVTVFGKQVRHFVRWKPSSFAIDKFKLFEVSYTDCPANVLTDTFRLNMILDSAVEMRIKDFSENDIIDYQKIELNGFMGRAFFYDTPKGSTTVSVKICIAEGKLYDLVVVAKKDYAINEDMSKFFNSFKLLK